ncbi:MAG: prolyl oligopeptidase family serine peptidase [Bryobacterales bacterium]|nr:prolyl oligopeptidase family serine peptidase [Bryobacterales bacterium]
MKYALFFILALSAAPPPTDAAADFALRRWQALHARFSPQMKAAATVEKLEALAQFGVCQPPAEPPVTSTPRPGLSTSVYKIVCEKRTLGLSLTTSADGLIQGMFFVEPPTGLNVTTGIYQLPARLTLPPGPGPFPAVVLVHGSGPHDMDETIGPNKPLRDIAEGLAARGIASLRYTKRTRQYKPANITLNEETIQDAVSAASLLRSTAKIDPARVFIAGHSLGAYAAPRIGQADPKLAGLILLAGNTRPITVLIDEQIKYLGGTPAQAEQMKRSLPAAYLEELAADPVPVAAALAMPMFILQGERDYQVTMEDFKRWQALKGTRVTLKSYPNLNHLFQPGEGKSKPAEYAVATPFAAPVLDDIAAWILSIRPPTPPSPPGQAQAARRETPHATQIPPGHVSTCPKTRYIPHPHSPSHKPPAKAAAQLMCNLLFGGEFGRTRASGKPKLFTHSAGSVVRTTDEPGFSERIHPYNAKLVAIHQHHLGFPASFCHPRPMWVTED